jgi:hypothetical protein
MACEPNDMTGHIGRDEPYRTDLACQWVALKCAAGLKGHALTLVHTHGASIPRIMRKLFGVVGRLPRVEVMGTMRGG